jgi:hypothetical protein
LATADASALQAALDSIALGAGEPPAKREQPKGETPEERAAQAKLATGLEALVGAARSTAGVESQVGALLRRLGRVDSRAGLESALAEAFAPHEGVVEKALERLCKLKGV